MIHILFVGEGQHDEVVVPALVRALLGLKNLPTHRQWARLNGGRGFERKLRYALAQAQDAGAVALVATVDGDKEGNARPVSLREGRARYRENHPSFPAALGCAIPHVEAWLIDDLEAVRAVFRISAEQPVRLHGTPKNTLDALTAERRCTASGKEVREELAERIDVKRCRRAAETGLRSFYDDLKNELGALVTPP